MQNMLEKKQMEAWGQFITKRRMKLMKVSNSTSPQQSHLAPPTTSSSEPPSITGKLTTTIQGTGAVSPCFRRRLPRYSRLEWFFKFSYWDHTPQNITFNQWPT
ncbi:hypothetical protein Pst134EA_028243 [Puccinia striiformis f. sp. tritici]|uniref:hypothetical protein n=1 Tax=Puccinia striiformis f. sp. tritici TaxID=168172 RepID=UPI0020077F7E|nr:hypothetical protein Pst134EA_028243 [Puccinia striiformis f. sp. tritici]KAH9448958.1 hypothetical protein Pst134EA_028243 [Puccinia striiformis f. sp. tritici]